MKKKILGEVLYEEAEHVYRGYTQYKVREVTLQRWLRIVVHINNKIFEEDVLGVTGVTLFVNFKDFVEDTIDRLKKIFEFFESEGMLKARQYDSTEITTEYDLPLEEPHFLSAREGQPELKDEIRVWAEEFLDDNGAIETLVTAIKSKNLDLEGQNSSGSWGQSMGNPKERNETE